MTVTGCAKLAAGKMSGCHLVPVICVVIQAKAGQVRSQTQQQSVAATFADIAAATARRLTHCSSSLTTWLTRLG